MLAAVVLALLVMPVAIAGAQTAGASAGSKRGTPKQIKVLKKRTTALTRRLSALEALLRAPGGPLVSPRGAPTSLPPDGPAGGDLSGSYPDPQIRAGSILSADIANDTILGIDIADDTIDSVDVANGSLAQADLGFNSVGGLQLVGALVATSPPGTMEPHTAGGTSAICPPDTQLIGGGAEWESTAVGVVITKSVPGNGNNWEVFGLNDTNTSRTLLAKALCLNG